MYANSERKKRVWERDRTRKSETILKLFLISWFGNVSKFI